MDPEQGAYLLEHGRFEISALVRVQLTRDTRPTKELGHKDISDSDCFLIWECIHFRPFAKTVHRNEDVLVTLIGFWQRSQEINGNTLHELPNIVQLQRRSLLYPRAFSSRTEVTPLTPFFNIMAAMNPVEPFTDFSQRFGNP